MCCPFCLLAAGPNLDRAHLLFQCLFFTFQKESVTLRQSANDLFNSCDRCHNRLTQPNEQMCVIWPRVCSSVCSYIMGDVYTARRKRMIGGQILLLLWKQWLFSITWFSCSYCHASVWPHLLLTAVAKISVWKLLLLSNSSEESSWGTSLLDLNDGIVYEILFWTACV